MPSSFSNNVVSGGGVMKNMALTMICSHQKISEHKHDTQFNRVTLVFSHVPFTLTLMTITLVHFIYVTTSTSNFL